MMRWIRRALAALLVLIALVLASWPFVVTQVFGPLLEDEWGGPAEVGRARWFFGDTLVLHDVVAPQHGTDRPMLEVDRIELRFERVPLLNDPGKLVAADFHGGRLRWRGREIGTVERVAYRYGGETDKRLSIHGLDGTFATSHPGAWIELVTRITEAPGVAGDGEGEFLREVTTEDSRLGILLAVDEGEPQRLRLDPFACRLRPTATKALAIERCTATVLDGELFAHGSVDWSHDRAVWHAQAHLARLDLAAAGAALDWLPRSATGTVTAFADLGTTEDGDLGGAGWLEGRDVAAWEQPVAEAVADRIGLEPTREDAFDEVRAEVLLDRGHLWFERLVALGEPINLFGNGSLSLDDGELAIGFVPRFRAERIDEMPLDGDDVHDVVLDVLKGSLVEVRVTGPLDDVDAFVQPLPLVTEPLRRFLALFR